MMFIFSCCFLCIQSLTFNTVLQWGDQCCPEALGKAWSPGGPLGHQAALLCAVSREGMGAAPGGAPEVLDVVLGTLL